MNNVINRIAFIMRIYKRNLLFGMKVELRDKMLDLLGQRIELSIFIITIFYTQASKDLILIMVNKISLQNLQFCCFKLFLENDKEFARINYLYSSNTYYKIINKYKYLAFVPIMSQSLPVSSQKIIRFSMKKLGIKEGKSFLITDLPIKVLKLLSDDKTIVSIKLLESPLHFIHNLKQELLLFVKENYDYLTGAEGGLITFNKLNVTRGCLLGLSLAAKYIDNQYLPININHHEILIQFEGGLFLILGFCDDGLEYISGIDDEQLINRRPGNKIIKSYQGNYRGKKLEKFLHLNQEEAYNLLFWNCQDFARELINFVVGINQEVNV